MHFEDTIRAWFQEEHGGSLLLPDGWYGRPYDNIHRLSSLEERDNNLTIGLDGVLLLHFEHLISVDVRNRNLILDFFEVLHFEWKSYNSSNHGEKDYQAGEVKLMAHPGQRVRI